MSKVKSEQRNKRDENISIATFLLLFQLPAVSR